MRVKKNSVGAISDGYHIGDRDDGHDDDDGSTRSWPSRTCWGAAFSLAEKFPFLFERRFGIRAYDYWWGYTSVEIDLMVLDQPVVNYNYGKKKNGRSMIATKREVDELDALQSAWEKKRGGRTVVGEEFSLREFVGGGQACAL